MAKTKCIEVIPVRICRKKVPTGKLLKCIKYEVIQDTGEIHSYSYISLDMKWIKPQTGSSNKGWHKLEMNEDGFFILQEEDCKLHELVVEMVTNMAIETILVC